MHLNAALQTLHLLPTTVLNHNPPAPSLVARDSDSSSTTTVATSTTSSSATDPYCIPFQDPDNGVSGYCQCSDGSTSTFVTTSGGNPCPYTSDSNAPAAPTSGPCSTVKEPDPSCWDTLELTKYVTNWWNENEAQCDGWNGFSDCWFGTKTRYTPSNCYQVELNSACHAPAWPDFEGQPNAPEDFYVSWALYQTQAFYVNFYQAINNAQGPLSDQVGAIVNVLNQPLPKPPAALEYLLDALTFGLSLWAEGSIITKALVRTAPQSASLIGKLVDGGDGGDETLNTTITAWSDVQDQIGQFTKNWSTSVGQGLPILINNVTLWTAFVESDTNDLVGQGNITLDGLTDSLGDALGPYLVSACLNELSYIITRSEQMDIHNFSSTMETEWDTGCENGYDDNGVCGLGFYYDGQDTWSLADPGNMDGNMTEVFTALFTGSSPATSASTFFSNAASCGCTTSGGCDPSIDFTGNSATCLAGTPVCVWDEGNLGPFTNCDSSFLPKYNQLGCKGNWDYLDASDQISVPLTYFGYGILKFEPNPKTDPSAPFLNAANAPYWITHYACNGNYELS